MASSAGLEGAIRSTQLVGTEMALLPLAILVEFLQCLPVGSWGYDEPVQSSSAVGDAQGNW